MRTTIIALTLMSLLFTACTSAPVCKRDPGMRELLMEAHGLNRMNRN